MRDSAHVLTDNHVHLLITADGQVITGGQLQAVAGADVGARGDLAVQASGRGQRKVVACLQCGTAAGVDAQGGIPLNYLRPLFSFFSAYSFLLMKWSDIFNK
ncbi:hypothetical protein [Xanthomonas arboricola]|uniref:hypothetical protein n=1 Tax=Xanthomonas arboricola TaxID=56448 RepID=UPI001C8625B3|nr:hypothetical protein [Xanthomonas arboricola]